MRVCDVIAQYIYQAGIKDVFMVSGGGLMYLTDGLACNRDLNVICCHHEQAVSMAAAAYAKYNGFGCGYVTTGCGGTNAITGVLHAWQDNTPCIFISGQCKRKETIRNQELPLRQLGVQEADIIKIVESITKYAVMVNEPSEIIYHLEKAEYLAKSGRPGPVWLDIPMDVQSAQVEPERLPHFDKKELYHHRKEEITPEELSYLAKKLEQAKRPVIIAGQGIRLAGAVEQFYQFVHKYEIPVVCSRLGRDILPTEDEFSIGCIGNKGVRAANFAVQNADFVLALGSRLSVSSTGQEYSYFAREAEVVVVDIDEYEHLKNTVRIDRIINGDIKNLFGNEAFAPAKKEKRQEWLETCRKWKAKYPACLEEYYHYTDGIDLYVFMNELSKCLKEDSVIVSDAGSAVYVPAQAIKTTSRNQRYITSGAQAEMGFTVPGAIGVCVARGKKEVIGITGDGSLQMNIQELQTIAGNHLPVKLFVWNNGGYLSIRATQKKFFEGRFIGTDETCGVTLPDLEKISEAYGIRYQRIEKAGQLEERIRRVLQEEEAVICEIMCRWDQVIQPTVSSKTTAEGRLVSSPIEDMFPFLEREEFKGNMLVETVGEE